MTRLRRSLKPYIAALRLSQTQVILFIEGSDFDPIFYGKILQRYKAESSLSTELRRATELPSNAQPGKGGSGGKIQLIRAAELWERYKTKHATEWVTKKTLAFCIDKDVEDMTGLPLFIPSLIRTPNHSVENHLFSSVSVSDAVESTLCLAPGEAHPINLSNEEWKRQASKLWLDWVVFCIMCLRLEVERFPNYSTPSLFNKPFHAPSDTLLSEPHFSLLKTACSFNDAEFAQMRQETAAVVSEMFNADQHDRIFKGKWYCEILFSQILATQWKPQISKAGKNGLMIAIRSKFVLSDEDYRYYRDSLRQLTG